MIRRPPSSTRTDTLFPYTTLFRSQIGSLTAAIWMYSPPFALYVLFGVLFGRRDPVRLATRPSFSYAGIYGSMKLKAHSYSAASMLCPFPVFSRFSRAVTVPLAANRTETRRVGKEGVKNCRTRLGA